MAPPPAARLLTRVFILASPLLLLVGSYILLDPFQVLGSDLDYPYFVSRTRFGVPPNRDVMNTEILLKHHARRRYDAFIFGNSRSIAFHCRDWSRWIGPARPWHYDASGESLFGLRGKIRLLERQGIVARHALFVLDADLLRETRDSPGPTFVKHPAVSGRGTLSFHVVFLKAFLSQLFFLKYVDYRSLGEWRPYMAGAIDPNYASPGFHAVDVETNDGLLPGLEKRIDADPTRYYAGAAWSKTRAPSHGAAAIGEAQVGMLQEIRHALARSRTDYEIVVSPSFHRVRLNPRDLSRLRAVFDADRVHDFSEEDDLTLPPSAWYDEAHYRPAVAREILRRVYSSRTGRGATNAVMLECGDGTVPEAHGPGC